MKKYTKLLSLFILISCGQQENKIKLELTEKVEEKETLTKVTKITFNKFKGNGLLLGNQIKLLDENLEEIKDITYLNENVVEITEISDKFYKINSTDDYCEEFKYVKIKTKDFEGYIDGRNVYELINHSENKIIKINENQVSFTATRYFGIGVSDENGLTGCSINSPVIFADRSINYEGVVKMVKNKNYQDSYSYFELKNDDMSVDEILSVDKQTDKYILSIKRNFQEGSANLKVAIFKNVDNKYVAEIIDYVNVEEELL